MVSNKVFLIVLVIVAVLISVCFLIAFNVAGLGDTVKGWGGPLGKGAVTLFQKPFEFGLQGGAQTAVMYLAVIGLVCAGAYAVWHYDIPYKWQNASAPSVTGDYTNTMNREPTSEPERGPTASR